MSDLGAIFHVKKDGIQYDAHAYTTTDECPYPNLKINFKGQQGYVKLEDKGSGDVPCYVKPKSEDKIYQVRKEAIPTGSQKYPYWTSSYTTTFNIPYGINVIRCYQHFPTSRKPIQQEKFIGVTAGKTYTFRMEKKKVSKHFEHKMVNSSSEHIWNTISGGTNTGIMLEWSPEINKQTPTETDYI